MSLVLGPYTTKSKPLPREERVCYITQFVVIHGNNTVYYNLNMMSFQRKTEVFTLLKNQSEFVKQFEYALAVMTVGFPPVTAEQICYN